MVMTKCKGRVDLNPIDINYWVDQLALALSVIHQIAPTSFSWFLRITLEVYSGWGFFGMKGINVNLLRSRLEEYVVHLCK